MPAAAEKPLQKSLFGGFGEPSYISTDPDKDKSDGYIKQEVIPSRYLGRNMKTGRCPKGRNPEVYFDKKYATFASATQTKDGADKYVDPGKADLKSAKDAKGKNVSEKDFKMASFPKKPLGVGSNFGTFGGQIDHKPEYKVTARGDPSDLAVNKPKKQMPNILTRPGKKGTYGVPNTTIGKAPEAPKQSDEYDSLRKKDRELWEAAKAKRIGTGVFRATVPAKETFDQKKTGVSSVYDNFDMPNAKEKKGASPQPEGAKQDKPWKSAGQPKPYLNKFANTRGENDQDPYDTLRLKRKEEKEKGPKPLAGVWKPVAGSKTAVVRSLLKRYY